MDHDHEPEIQRLLTRTGPEWDDESATPVTKKTAERLGIRPGELNGYFEVFELVFCQHEDGAHGD